jgi:hypothetical protein
VVTHHFAVRLSLCMALLCALAISVFGQNASPAAPAVSGSAQPKKEKKDKRAAADVISDASEFSEAVANEVLAQVRNGIEARNQRLVLSAFDREKFGGYLGFEDQLQGFFEKYESFRTYFRVLQTSVEGGKGVVLAEFDIECTPVGGGAAMRRNNQLRFELQKGSRGWKIVDMRPRGFLS